GANGSASVTVRGTIFNINNALNGLVYTPTTGYSGTDTLTILSDDLGNTGTGSALTDTDSVTITISGNAPPANTVPLAQTTPENTPAAATFLTFSAGNGNALSVTDPAATSTSDRVTLSVANGALTLGSTAGLVSFSGNNTGSVTFSG